MIQRSALFAVLLSGGLTSTALAADFDLRFAEPVPPTHVTRTHLTIPFMEAVEKATDGKVEFQEFPGGQLGKGPDMLRIIQSGVADMGQVVPTYMTDKMPLSTVADLPGAIKKSCAGAVAYLDLAQEGAILADQDFTPQGIKVLAALMLPSYEIKLATDRPVASLADLKGLKIRTAGPAMDAILEEIGAVPIRMTAGEVHESMMRGTIDGVLFSFQSIISYDLGNMVKTAVTDANFGTAAATYAIGLDAWNNLPKDVQDVMVQAGRDVTKSACRAFAKEEEDSRAQVVAAGAKLVTLNAEDQAVLDSVMAKVREDWAKNLDAAGKKGSEALGAYLDAQD